MPPEKMATSAAAFPAAPGWRSLHLRPPAARAAVPAPCFHTQAVPGELRPEAAAAGWRFHLGVPPAESPSAQLITSGFHLGSADAPAEAWVVLTPGGGLLGETRGRLQPALFAPHTPVQQDGDLTWVDDAAASACLVVRTLPEGRTRFALIMGEAARDPAEMRARLLVKADPLARWAAEWAPRQAAFAALGPAGAAAGEAIEQVAAALQPPDRLADRRWLARRDDLRRLDVDATLPVVLAWRDIDRSLARDVLVSAVGVAHEDGWFPAHTRTDQPGTDLHLAWPCLALAARALDEPAAALPEVVDALQRQLYWWAEHWTTAASAGPAEAPGFDPERPPLRPAALAALLLAEAAAWRAWVAVGAPERADDPVIRTAQLAWRTTIESVTTDADWTPAERACRAVAGFGPSPAAPDPAADEGDALARSLWLLAGPSPTEALTPSAESCAPAAAELAAALIAARAGRDRAAGPGVAGWLDQRRPLAWTLLGLGALLFLAAVVGSTLTRETMTASTVETQAGLAARYYAEGRYDDALALYQRIHEGGRHVMRVEGQIANAHFRAGRLEQAATWYQQAVVSSPQSPGPAINLALTLHQLGRDGEAISQYQAFQQRFGEAFPELAERARLAESILRERQDPASTAPADAASEHRE